MIHTENRIFFLIIAPGWEKLALAELQEKVTLFFPHQSPPTCKVEKGGIELLWDMTSGLTLCYLLKIPTNILLRLDHFRCRDFPRLYQKLGKIPWRNFLTGPVPAPHISVSCQRSRLLHTQRIQQTAEQALAKYFQGNPPAKKLALPTDSLAQGHLLIRFQDDECSISLACAGERLSLRGYRPYVLDAPLRENLAAAIVYFLRQKLPLANYHLIDPMCGAGTHLLEAALFFTPNFARPYHFEYFPVLQAQAQIIPQIKSQLAQVVAGICPLYQAFLGYDHNPAAIAASQNNWQLARQLVSGIDIAISWEMADLLATVSGPLPLQSPEQKNMVIINPPFGKRLHPDHPDHPDQDLESFYQTILKQCQGKSSPELLALLIPQSFSPHKIADKKFDLIDRLPFEHGGLAVQCLLFCCKSPANIH